ncbi:MAG: cysteine desulfurase-like protein [Acidobacteriota bacterium]|nr:MAG: cysteine desulfurase-like protein [Acidobacteriota bacterium]
MAEQQTALTSAEVETLEKKRAEFPSLRRTIDGRPLAYFDGPGGSQVPQSVIDAVSWYYQTCNANSHGCFCTSEETDQVLEDSRRVVAAFLNAEGPGQISFGANMTTLNFALSHALGRALRPGDEVLITQLDHEANRGPWLNLRRSGIVVREVAMKQDGTLDYDDFDSKIGERTRIVAVGHASNALGTVNEIPRIRRAATRVGAWLVIDAVHSAPHLSLDVQAMAADFLMCSAYKFYGPHVGILYARANLLDQFDTDRLRTQEGHAPYRIETGTLNHAAIAGVKAAVEFIASIGQGNGLREKLVSAMTTIEKHERMLATRFHQTLQQIDSVTVYGQGFDVSHRAPTVSLAVNGWHPAEVARELGRQGILVWDGDFYAARAVEILGLANRGGLVRVGLSLYSTGEEIDRILDAVAGLR